MGPAFRIYSNFTVRYETAEMKCSLCPSVHVWKYYDNGEDFVLDKRNGQQETSMTFIAIT
jgi:hypothetical protein